MVFYPPAWVPKLPEVPDSITLEEFLREERYGRHPVAKSRNPYTCGLTGRTHSASEMIQRVDLLSRALAKRLRFDPNDGTEWDRVVGLFSLNTVDYIPFTSAIHRLNGIVTPASAAYSASELEHQLRSSGSRAVFTCVPLLETALKAAKGAGIPEDMVFILPMPGQGNDKSAPFITLDDMVEEGKSLASIPPLNWTKGQGARQTAYLCYSSGTSGLPKAVMISHQNVIANVMQTTVFEKVGRQKNGVDTQVILGILPFSHIYGLTLITLLTQYRGDEVIVLPKFDLETLLSAVHNFKINQLSVVPPILIQLFQNKALCDKYDLSSVRWVFSGAAPLGSELQENLLKRYPKWGIGQGYGMTELSPLATSTSEDDSFIGSSGSLVPGTKAKIIDVDGKEVTSHEGRGELFVQSPSVVLGYLHNEKANAETFVHHDDGRWIRTGDEVLVRNATKGNEHFFVVDRIKELIKVKGHQVAPAELEAHLLAHEFVADCAVIQVQDERAGEVPKAFVVKSTTAAKTSDEEAITTIKKHVEEHKAKHKWLKGGVEFIDVIPKSASGKILRRRLRDKEKQTRREQGAKL